MKCENCSKEMECYEVPIYYAFVRSRTSNTHDELLKLQSTTTTVTKYGEIKKRNYRICSDCVVSIKKRSVQMTPVYSLIFLVATSLIAKLIELFGYITGNIFYIILFIASGIFILLTANSIRALAKKTYKKIYKGSLYYITLKLFKKELGIKFSSTDYEFWDSYPKHLKVDKR